MPKTMSPSGIISLPLASVGWRSSSSSPSTTPRGWCRRRSLTVTRASGSGLPWRSTTCSVRVCFRRNLRARLCACRAGPAESRRRQTESQPPGVRSRAGVRHRLEEIGADRGEPFSLEQDARRKTRMVRAQCRSSAHATARSRPMRTELRLGGTGSRRPHPTRRSRYPRASGAPARPTRQPRGSAVRSRARLHRASHTKREQQAE